jgi:hypothetical protein
MVFLLRRVMLAIDKSTASYGHVYAIDDVEATFIKEKTKHHRAYIPTRFASLLTLS